MSQWTHECPYPHVMKEINPLTPSEWFKQHGRGIDASVSEVAQSMRLQTNETALGFGVDMSQWTMDEEMRTDYTEAKEDVFEDEEGKAFSLKTAVRVLSFAVVPLAVVGGVVRSNARACMKVTFGSKKVTA